MKTIHFLIRYSPGFFLIGLLAALVSGAARAGFIVLTSVILGHGNLAAAGSLWLLGGMCVAMPLTRLLSQLLLLKIAQESMYQMVLRLSGNILMAPLRKLEEVGAHQLQALLTKDVASLSDSLASLPEIFLNITILAGCLIYLGTLSTFVLLLTLASMLAAIVIVAAMNKWTTAWLQKVREDIGTLFKHFNSLVIGIKELKMNPARRGFFYDQCLGTAASNYRKHNTRANTLYSATWSVAEFQFMLLIFFIAVALPALTHVRDPNAVSYVIILLFMTGPMIQLGFLYPLLARADVSLQKMKSVGFGSDTLGMASASSTSGGQEWSRLELKGVTHSYHVGQERDSFVLGPLDLAFEPGQTVFIMGGNGSGKTTLIKLLVGLYIPESGTICLNGDPVSNESREQYRRHFSAVFADSFIFDEVIGAETPQGEKLAQDYLRDLELDSKLQIKQGKASTTDLSQGQRKRLALLSAFLEDRPIYIFDEWAAHQDPHFRDMFYMVILPALKTRGKTLIVITHDDHYSHTADRIIRLDYGAIESDTMLPAAHDGIRQQKGLSASEVRVGV